MGHYASEMGLKDRTVTCSTCGETGTLSEAIVGGLHCTPSECIRHLKAQIDTLAALLAEAVEKLDGHRHPICGLDHTGLPSQDI